MNSNEIPFKSSLREVMSDFICYKQMQGYTYIRSRSRLREFDTFLCKKQYSDKILAKCIIDEYIASKSHLCSRTKSYAVSIIRQFSQYLNMLQPLSWICRHPVPIVNNRQYYIFSRDDINNLLEATRKSTRQNSVVSKCMYFLLGLLYTNGLRISEATKLRIGDIDFQNQTLFIRKGKFGKSRYVCLDSSVMLKLNEWLAVRRGNVADASETALFINSRGTMLSSTSARRFFHKLLKLTEFAKNTDISPRLHSLRHTYACNCIEQWRKQGDDVNAKLPILSTAMSHVNIQATQIYMHITLNNLQDAAERFHDFILK